MADTGETWSFVTKRVQELNSPIIQLFMRGPLRKPWVVITDFRESLDIQTVRQGEFDRSAFLADVFGPLLPYNHVWVSNDCGFLSTTLFYTTNQKLKLAKMFSFGRKLTGKLLDAKQ